MYYTLIERYAAAYKSFLHGQELFDNKFNRIKHHNINLKYEIRQQSFELIILNLTGILYGVYEMFIALDINIDKIFDRKLLYNTKLDDISIILNNSTILQNMIRNGNFENDDFESKVIFTNALKNIQFCSHKLINPKPSNTKFNAIANANILERKLEYASHISDTIEKLSILNYNKKHNSEQIVNALTELLYYTHDTFNILGLDTKACIDILHLSNLSRLCISEDDATKTMIHYKFTKSYMVIKCIKLEYTPLIDRYLVYDTISKEVLNSKYFKSADYRSSKFK